MKYCVTIVRTGCIFVEADSEAKAIDIADHQLTDTISWSDDWSPTDAEPDDSIPDNMCIRERAFE